jgi:hypothetical protein
MSSPVALPGYDCFCASFVGSLLRLMKKLDSLLGLLLNGLAGRIRG